VQRNEESHGFEHILKKQIVFPNETANWRWNEESHGFEHILKKQIVIPNEIPIYRDGMRNLTNYGKNIIIDNTLLIDE
jgi:hypothetical protein